MPLSALITGSVILAGFSVILQTTSFIIPGWLILEAKEATLSLALWYVVFCERIQTNMSEVVTECEHFTYRDIYTNRNAVSIFHFRTGLENHMGTQVQVTSCWLLAIAAFVLVCAQKRTFHSQDPVRQSIYHDEPKGTCNLRAKFLYSGGFALIFQMFSGVLLSLVIIDFSKRYFSQSDPRPAVPYVLFIAGTGVLFSALCSALELYIVFRTKERRGHPRNPHDDAEAQQKIRMAHLHHQGSTSQQENIEFRQPSIDQTECAGDYFGLEYSAEDPALMYRTQGTKHCDKINKPFPGYRLAKQNMRGHDKEWWSKVTYASMPYI